MKSRNKSGAQWGFTLIEVMVALTVVAVALPALLLLVMAQLDGAGQIREKTYAHWVAENELTRIRMRQAYFPQERLPERETGQVELGGTLWYWEALSETTDVENFYRLDLSVRLGQDADSQRLALISGFVRE
jgi:general secretion pathway protein I